MTQAPHILFNGLSIGSGGGYRVAGELFRRLAGERPSWRFTLVLTRGSPWHEQLGAQAMPENARPLWAPSETSRKSRRAAFENYDLANWARDQEVSAAVQPNGMIVPRLRVPAFCHFQDPWPYRPEAWRGLRDRLVAAIKRRENLRALRAAAACGWTSRHLRDLILSHHGLTPRRESVCYNGAPDEWLERARGQLPSWNDRPLELITLGNVSPYKRQDLVIRAVAELARRPEWKSLVYRVVGDVEPQYRAALERLVRELAVEANVVFEGRVSDQRVAELLRQARVMVLMSVCESFGLPLIEAMTFGAPVVAADCCALPEVCGGAGELVPPDDLPALVDRLAKVLGDPHRADSLRRAGAERVQAFSWSGAVRTIAAALDDMALPGGETLSATAARDA